jgi:hypothetical protein
VNHEVISRLLEIAGEHLVISVRPKLWHDIANTNVDHSQEALVLLLELLLIKHLNSEDAAFVRIEIKALVPVWVQSSLADARRLGLFAVDRCDRKGIGEAKNIALVEPIGGNDYDAISVNSRGEDEGIVRAAGVNELVTRRLGFGCPASVRLMFDACSGSTATTRRSNVLSRGSAGSR